MLKKDCIAVTLILCLLLTNVSCQKKETGAVSESHAATAALTPLDQLLAPIALYPDALLAQVLACATSPQQVTEVNNWLQQNSDLRGTQLQDAANQQGFDASFVALTLFPDVLNMMAGNIDWTTELGTAFLSDQEGVMDSVQTLRAAAQTAGNLQTTSQQEVSTEVKDGEKTITIQPANPQVVYVPVYDTQTVYTTPPPAAPTTSSASSDSGKTAAAAVIGFAVGVAIGASMNNNYYAPYGWGAWGMGWHTHTVVVVGRPWGVPPYARYPYVRPVPVAYGGYHPRANVYAPKNININNVNVNRNMRVGTTPRPQPYSSARPTSARIKSPRPTTPAVRPTAASTKLAGTAPVTRRPATPASSRTSVRSEATPQRPTPSSAVRTSDYGSRGYSQTSSQLASNTRPSERAQTSSSAFSGYQNGRSEHTASQRGQRSVSSSQRRTRAARR